MANPKTVKNYATLSKEQTPTHRDTMQIDDIQMRRKKSLIDLLCNRTARERHQGIAAILVAFSYLMIIYDIHGRKEPEYIESFNRHPQANEIRLYYNDTEMSRWTITAGKVVFMFVTAYAVLRENYRLMLVGLVLQVIESLLVFEIFILYIWAYPDTFRLLWVGSLCLMEGFILNSLIRLIKSEHDRLIAMSRSSHNK